MRKLAVFSMIVTLCGISVVYGANDANFYPGSDSVKSENMVSKKVEAGAGCIPAACGGRGDDCINIYDMTVDPSSGTPENETYICEEGYCENGTIIHDRALERFYMCVISSKAGVNLLGMGNDTWKPYSVATCVVPKDGYISSPDSNATKVLRNSTRSEETFRKPDTGSVVLGIGQNICIEYKCNDGYKPNSDKTGCVLAQQKSQDQLDCESERAKASGAKWSAPKNKCDCASGKKWDSVKKICVVVKTTTPVAQKPKWTPVDGGKTDSSFQCLDKELAQLQEWKTTYSSDAEISALISKIIELCEGENLDEENFEKWMAELRTLIDRYNAKTETERTLKYKESTTTITTITKNLDGAIAGFGTTVWKDKDGEFNTSRLISDSVAGVVLGTAGGLITSSVVKKSQVKSGFEDINCTVGGQVVAGWGDEFNVGIR